MTRHLKPLYIKALINGKPFSQVFIDKGVVLNVMPIITLKKLGKSMSNLISTNMKMTNFTGDVMVIIEVLVANITVGLKTFNSAFFMVDAKPTYSVLLGRDWMHSSQLVLYTLHQLLMFLEGGKVEVVPANTNPFSINITMVKAIFYSRCVGPIMLTNDYEERSMESFNLTNQGFKWRT